MKKSIVAYMIQLGTRMWKTAPEKLDFEYLEWRKVTEKAAAAGFNTLLIDLGEGVFAPFKVQIVEESAE